MTMPTIPDPIAETFAEAVYPTPPAPPRNPAAEDAAAALEAALTRYREAARGVDPLIDRAILDLERETAALDEVVGRARRLRAQGDAGIVPRERVAAALAKAEAQAEASKADLITRAKTALEVGRDRLLDELVGDPGRPEDAGQAKGDLELTMRGYADPAEAVTRAFDDAIRRGDDLEVRLLVGRWGAAQFRARGGSDELWQGVRRQMLEKIASEARRQAPRGPEARKWDVVLGNAPDQYLQVAADRLRQAIAKVRG